jgi:hypothetical protein
MAAGSTYTPIATYTAGSSFTTYSFTSIPSTYTDLVIIMNAKSASGTPSIYMQYNGDTTSSNYSYTGMYGRVAGAVAGGSRATTINWVSAFMDGVSPNNFNNGIIQINNYSNTTTYKTNLCRWAGADYEVDAMVGMWKSTSAINQVTLTAQTSLAAGCTFTLYGIKAA